VTGIDIIVYVNNVLQLFYRDTMSGIAPAAGLGFNFSWGGGASTYITEGDAGHLYTGAPSGTTISASPMSSEVDLSWTAATETGGIGVYGYQVLRNGVPLISSPTTALTYTDLTTSPNSTYTYTVRAIDYHWNTTDTTITVSTPIIPISGPYPSATPDGFRIGSKPTGTYWGAGNENIDVFSVSFRQGCVRPVESGFLFG
jgi:hypothetical protein